VTPAFTNRAQGVALQNNGRCPLDPQADRASADARRAGQTIERRTVAEQVAHPFEAAGVRRKILIDHRAIEQGEPEAGLGANPAVFGGRVAGDDRLGEA